MNNRSEAHFRGVVGQGGQAITPDGARPGGRVFRGRYEHTIDPKGRLSIPSRYRDELATRRITTLVLSEGDHCVSAFPLDEWEKLEESLRQHSPFSPERRNIVRVMVASAKECPVDRAGRTLVPPELREFAGLKKDVVIAGALESFEIWSRERWIDHRQTLRGGFDDMTRKLSEHGI
jgi:MraZ protein